MPYEIHGPGNLSDTELLKRMTTGDREAFAVLFRRHQRSVYRFALQMTGATDVAEDITQDVFMALARAAGRYTPVHGALSTYLYGIARHLVLQRQKRTRSRHEIGLAGLDERDMSATSRDPIDRLAETERIAMLRRAILRLPAHYREVIVLCEVHGLSYDEAAAVIGCPVGTIRSRLNRARRLLTERCRASLTMSNAADAEPSASWLLTRRPRVAGPGS